MAKLYIREFDSMPYFQNAGGTVMIWPEDGSAIDQVVDFSGGVTSSSTFNAKTKFIAMRGDATFAYKVGPTPTATTSSFTVDGNQILVVAVTGGHKISAISNT